MKIDLLKCQNCRFKAKVDGEEKTGRIQIVNNCIKFWFDYHDELNDVICHSISMEIYSEYGFGEFFDDLEIVPRNPKTYKDWQVGDKMERISEAFDPNIEVVFRSGEFVVCKTEQGYASINYLCDELFNEGYRLVLTDIEKQIIEERKKAEKKCVENIPKPYEFKKGEPVLVRDDGRIWVIRVYIETENGFYSVTSAGTDKAFYRYCIPYNEKTMHLLGSTEDYEEE